MKFIVWRNAAGEWMWTLWARNGKRSPRDIVIPARGRDAAINSGSDPA